jgi:23S rRNA pseudouridine1911/1915/1917 synthase
MPKIRLHKYIANLKTDYNNPQIQKNIGSFGVMINDKIVKNRLEWVYDTDQVIITNWPKLIKASFDGIRVVQDYDNYRILYKPCGLPVQSGVGHSDDNLVTYLLNNFADQRAFLTFEKSIENEFENRFDQTLGLAHRLDKDTEGLILVAKNLDSYLLAKKAFKNREVIKEYLVILTGKMESIYTVDGYQGRHPRNPVRQEFITPEMYDSNTKYFEYRTSKSVFTPIEHDPEQNLSLVKVKINTGRMHQIRVQAQALGFAVYQDTIYNNPHLKFSNDQIQEYKSSESLILPKSELQTWYQKFPTHTEAYKTFYLKSNLIVINSLGIDSEL